MKLTIACYFLISFALCAHAQNTSNPGYIVRINGDTLRGFLKTEVAGDLLNEVKFKTSLDEQDFTVYKTDAVKSFKFDEGNLYRVVSFINALIDSASSRVCFAKLLVTGEYNLYSFMEHGNLYFLAGKEAELHFLFDSELHGESSVRGNYQNELNFFSANCETVRYRIERTSFSEKDMMNFFKDLDACLAPSSVVSYYHKEKSRANLIAFVGGLPLGNRSQFTADLALRVVNPHINPQFSVNIGLRYADVVKQNLDLDYTVASIYYKETYHITSIPLSFQYNITRSRFQPFVYVGFSATTVDLVSSFPISTAGDLYYHKFNMAFLAGVGVEYYIKQWLIAKVDWRYEYLLQYPALGISFKL